MVLAPNRSEDSLRAQVLPHMTTLTVTDESKVEVKARARPSSLVIIRSYLRLKCVMKCEQLYL